MGSLCSAVGKECGAKKKADTRALVSSARLTLNPAQHLPYYFLGFRVTRRTPSPSHLAITASFLPPCAALPLSSPLPQLHPLFSSPPFVQALRADRASRARSASPSSASANGSAANFSPEQLAFLERKRASSASPAPASSRGRSSVRSNSQASGGAGVCCRRDCFSGSGALLPGALLRAGLWGWCVLQEGLFVRLRCIAARCAAALVCCCWG